jgi:hypothetical protein
MFIKIKLLLNKTFIALYTYIIHKLVYCTTPAITLCLVARLNPVLNLAINPILNPIPNLLNPTH